MQHYYKPNSSTTNGVYVLPVVSQQNLRDSATLRAYVYVSCCSEYVDMGFDNRTISGHMERAHTKPLLNHQLTNKGVKAFADACRRLAAPHLARSPSSNLHNLESCCGAMRAINTATVRLIPSPPLIGVSLKRRRVLLRKSHFHLSRRGIQKRFLPFISI